MRRIIRQGDVLLISVEQSDEPIQGNKLPDLVFALGEVTGHSHRVEPRDVSAAMLEITKESLERLLPDFEELPDSAKYLSLSGPEILIHEEHAPHPLSSGGWVGLIQREYEPEGWRYVAD